MGTDKPLISILMAVYEPRMDWLKEQLDSLNAQTYPNLRLYVRDDCSPTVSFAEIQAMVEGCITKFPYTIQRNEKNLGSNLTFERLTQEAEGEYFAYCDQDDIWLPEKLETLEQTFTESGVLLACSDMYVIDGEGTQMADSITKVRRHHVFHSGSNLAKKLLVHNFVTGCTMLVCGNAAKAAVPFCPYMVHDHYLALWCAEQGSIDSVRRPLIVYRIHSGNQTGILNGVKDKDSYERVRIDMSIERIRWLQSHFPCDRDLRQLMADTMSWLQARKQSWNHKGGGWTVWKYRRFSRFASVAELVLKYAPEKIFIKAVLLARKNRI